MDWNSRRITAIIENALNEDRATRDATSYACIDPGQRAAATIIAKQDCILAGVGCIPRILDAYATLDGAVTSHYEVTSHPSIFDGIRVHKGQQIAVITHNARVILSSAAAHSMLVQHAQSGRSLAGIQNSRLGAMYRFYEFSGQRRDPAQPLQQIQHHPLAGEHHAGIVEHNRNLLPFVQPHTVENLGMAGNLVMRNHRAVEGRINVEDPRNATQPG